MLLNDRYEPHERIGEGGMALVYRATDRRLGREVALKMLRPQYAADADFLSRFQQEAQAAARLQHPNIAAVFDTGFDQGHHYIVMELLKPFTLKDLIARSAGGRLPVEHAVRFATEVANALAHAHKHGVVHRDIKPQNILFTDDGHVKVSDFGIARALAGGSSTATGTILGSPHYISPEQARGEAAGPASDLYSLGVVLYEMLCGTTPYRGETPVAVAVQHLRGTPTPVSALCPDVPEPISMVVARAMAREPEARFASAADFAAALQGALSGRPPELAATTVMPRSELEGRPRPEIHVPSEERRGPAPATIAIFAVVIVLGAGFGMWLGGREPSTSDGSTQTAPAGRERRPIEVPNLIGRDVNAERTRLEQYYSQQGLEPPQIVEVGVEDSPEPQDRVLRQEPPPGAVINEGEVIRVWLSSGVEQVEVPDLTGMTLERADRALHDAGLFRANTKYEHSEEMVPDVVIRQSIKAGEKVRAQTGVDLVLSLGPKPTEPEPEPPTEPPAEIEPAVAVSSPEPQPDGTKMARVTVSLPAGAETADVELRWLEGAEGTAGGGSLDPGGLFEQEIHGSEGSVLGVFVNGRELKRVQF